MKEALVAALLAFVASVRRRTNRYREKARRLANGESVWVESLSGRLAWRVEPDPRAARGQLGQETVIAALTVVVVAFAALLAVDSLAESIDNNSTAGGIQGFSDDNLTDASNSVLRGFADMASLIGPVLIIGMIAVLIAIIQRVR